MNTSTSLLFTICIAFYFEMRRRMSTMGMLQGLDWRPRRFSNTYTNSMIPQDSQFISHREYPQTKDHDINSKKKCNVESFPHDDMVGLIPNLQLASIITQHKRPQCQIFKNEKNKVCHPVRESFANFCITLVRV
jgi:hypothetical protein